MQKKLTKVLEHEPERPQSEARIAIAGSAAMRIVLISIQAACMIVSIVSLVETMTGWSYVVRSRRLLFGNVAVVPNAVIQRSYGPK